MKSSFERPLIHPLRKSGTFAGLAVTTIVSFLLMLSTAKQRVISGIVATAFLQDNRASVQIAVQIISSVLGWLQVTVVCAIINYATRLRFSKVSSALDILVIWSCLSRASVEWKLQTRYLVPVALFVMSMYVPAALWAGAITPVSVIYHIPVPSFLVLPGYQNATWIREWPPEIGASGPLLRNSLGVFSYTPGVNLLGSLIDSAASATTADSSVRRHAKSDNTGFTYIGRSYGAGASVGIDDTDNLISSIIDTQGYFFQENGLRADVECVYNASTEWVLTGPTDPNIYPAVGYLPNSDGVREYSEYFAHGGGGSDGSPTTYGAIVAIGVSRNYDSPERILGIASGNSYSFLNTTQCTLDFVPKKFNVTVHLLNHTISVSEASGGIDFAASQNLTYALTRQFAILSDDLTDVYVSLLGDSFNSSINNFKIANNTYSETAAILAGLENSITAMADDLLVAFASAQLMIANDNYTASATVQREGIALGSSTYVYLIFAVNTAILLILVEEAIRTRYWKGMLYFDYTDARQLIVGSSMGGKAIGREASRASSHLRNSARTMDLRQAGSTRISLDCKTGSIFLDTTVRKSETQLQPLLSPR